MPKKDGKKIRDQARKIGYDESKAVTKSIKGKKVKITPAKSQKGKNRKDAEEDGTLLGYLETEAEGDETKLQPGKYHLWAERDPNEGWAVHAVDEDGNVKGKALRVEVTEYKGKPRKAEISEEGWCIRLATCFLWWCWYFWFCW
jgi:hypothetical protein